MVGRTNSEARRGAYRRWLMAVLLGALAVIYTFSALVLSSDAWAVEAPQVRELFQPIAVHSTRALVEPLVETYGAETKWRAGYSTKESPSGWIQAGEGTLHEGGTSRISIGASDSTTPPGLGDRCFVLHDLVPSTQYYAHFEVEDVGNPASLKQRTFPFETKAASAPEIPDTCEGVTSTLKETSGTRSTRAFAAQVETNDNPVEYSFEYTTEPSQASSWKPFTSSSSGTVSPAEVFRSIGTETYGFIENDFADPEAFLTGLKAETQYFVRVRACTTKCGAVEAECTHLKCAETSFTTPTERPIVAEPEVHNVSAESARISTSVSPKELETTWRYEYTSDPENPSSWALLPGAEGTITQSQAEALPENTGISVEGSLGAAQLRPSTKYCVRVYAANGAGEGENAVAKELILGEAAGWTCFETAGPPSAVTFASYALDGELPRFLGSVDPNSVATNDEQLISISGNPTGGDFTLS